MGQLLASYLQLSVFIRKDCTAHHIFSMCAFFRILLKLNSLKKSGSISAAPNEPSIKEDENENNDINVSNCGDSGIAESASAPIGIEDAENDASGSVEESEQPATPDQTEKKDEKYVKRLTENSWRFIS